VRADLFRNGAVGGVLGLLGLAGRLKRVRFEDCSLRWYVCEWAFRCDAVGKVALQRPHLVLPQSIVLWSALQLAHGYLLAGAGGVVAGLALRWLVAAVVITVPFVVAMRSVVVGSVLAVFLFLAGVAVLVR
jgi:hypothetical protein